MGDSENSAEFSEQFKEAGESNGRCNGSTECLPFEVVGQYD